jgi:DNA invertase Pin-like site-specific DNA recombinase
MKSKKSNQPKICALYARAAQSDTSRIQSQLAACRAAAVKWGWTVDESHVYTDDVVVDTIGIGERPGLGVLLAAVASRNRAFDCLLIERLDRLSRSIATAKKLITTLALWGVTVLVVDPPLDTSKDGAAIVLNILDAIEEATQMAQQRDEMQ